MSKRKIQIAKRHQLPKELKETPAYFRKTSAHSSEQSNESIEPQFTRKSNFFWIKSPNASDDGWHWENKFFPKDTDCKILKKAIKENNEYFNELIERRKARKNL